MSKTLNTSLFVPGFIFKFKWNTHLTIKDTSTWVMVINLDWDDCGDLDFFIEYWHVFNTDLIKLTNNLSHSLYKISHLDLLEEALSNDDISLLMEERYDTITMGDNY